MALRLTQPKGVKKEQAVFFGATLKVAYAETLVPADKPTRRYSAADRKLQYTCQHRPDDNKLPHGVSAGYLLNTSHNLSNAVYVKIRTLSK
jgi:hypothetical protein